MIPDTTQPDTPLLYGVKSIAAHLGLTPRQTQHLVDKGELPTFRLGATICSTATALADHFAALTAANRTETNR